MMPKQAPPETCPYCLLCHTTLYCPFSPSQNALLDGPPARPKSSTSRRSSRCDSTGKTLAFSKSKKGGKGRRPASAPAPHMSPAAGVGTTAEGEPVAEAWAEAVEDTEGAETG